MTKVEIEQRLINVNEYHQMAEVGILEEKGIELINGKILKTSPIGVKHTACVKKTNAILNDLLPKTAIIGIQDPIKLNDISEPEPDISILHFDKDFYANAHPKPEDTILVIEVADTTIDYDREIKAPLYAAALIPEYWLVDLNTKQITAYQSPKAGLYRKTSIFTTEDKIQLPTFNIQFDVEKIL